MQKDAHSFYSSCTASIKCHMLRYLHIKFEQYCQWNTDGCSIINMEKVSQILSSNRTKPNISRSRYLLRLMECHGSQVWFGSELWIFEASYKPLKFWERVEVEMHGSSETLFFFFLNSPNQDENPAFMNSHCLYSSVLNIWNTNLEVYLNCLSFLLT